MGETVRSNQGPSEHALAECRRLWNEFDPMGVYVGWWAAWPRDEYERYVRQTVKLLSAGADETALQEYVRTTVEVSMGLNGFPNDEIARFAHHVSRLSHCLP